MLTGIELPNAAWWIGMAGVVAMLGHIFPIWLGFRGGKGVATGVGVFAVLAPLPILCAGALFVIVVWSTRFVSLGSMLAAITIPLLIWLESFIRPVPDMLALVTSTLSGAALIIYAHRDNIERLLSGTENKFSR